MAKNKLADRIAKEKLTKYSDGHYTQFNGHENILMAMAEAMQAYHEAKMKEVTDEDIDVHIIEHYVLKSVPFCLGFTNGAKAFRDGEIKHIDA